VNREQAMVKGFHEAFQQTIGETPAIRDPELRAKLILEEAFETVEALLGVDLAMEFIEDAFATWTEVPVKHELPDLVAVADGCCDLKYVTESTAVACGFNMEPLFAEVHRSNMDKRGGTKRADGKWIKPANWTPPNIAGLLLAQGWKP
jgi:predicted HAD superfamily Cof-like phosphohydrolase